MTVTTLSSRELNQDVSRAKKAAADGRAGSKQGDVAGGRAGSIGGRARG